MNEAMRARRTGVAIRLCVLLSVAANLVLLVLVLNRDSAWLSLKRTYPVKVRFDRAADVQAGTPVTVADIPIGRVRRVGFADPDALVGGVVAEVAVGRDHRLRRGARARVMETGGGSRPRIEIVPGPPEEALLESGATISGEVVSNLSTLLSPGLAGALDKSAVQVGDAADALTAILSDFHALVRPLTPAAVDRAGGPPGNLPSALARLDTTLKSLNASLADPTVQTEWKETLHNLHAMSADGRQVAASAKEAFAQARVVLAGSEKLIVRSEETVTNVDQRVDAVTQNLNRTLDLLTNLLKELNPMAARMNRGEGTLGKMIQDDQLHEALLLTLRRLAAEKP